MKALKYLLLAVIILPVPFVLSHSDLPGSPERGVAFNLPFRQKRSSDKGLYITAWTAQKPSHLNYVKRMAKSHGLNTIVVDAKDMIAGPLSELIKKRELKDNYQAQPNTWLAKLTKELQDDGFIVTARVVVFKDDHLAIIRPDLAIPYRDLKGGRWVNPYSDEVRLYNALLAETCAVSGVDEVQFDYIRFPAEGSAAYLSFPEEAEQTRVEVITQFLKEVRERTAKYNTSLAVDIFGVTAWQSEWDVETLGQSLEAMSHYLDVLSPMFYPSHFHRGYDGFANPGSEPYYFVNMGVKKAVEILNAAGAKTKLVPWIQGFNMLSPNYGPGYIKAQVEAANDEGVEGFLIWNARNVYDNLPASWGN
ncbi:MAG: putative glycoside hydrolase [Candidatus Margulisiibacteriota bacterium]